MKKGLMKLMVTVGLVAAVVGLTCLGYKHFVLDSIRDGGSGMTNPNLIRTTVEPAEGAKLVYCSLSRRGMEAGDYAYYTLEQVDDEVLLYADYPTEDCEHKTIEREPVAPEVLEALNTLVLSIDLTESHWREDIDSEPILSDEERSYTLRWDDGTTATPDGGFGKIEEFFKTEVLGRMDEATAGK